MSISRRNFVKGIAGTSAAVAVSANAQDNPNPKKEKPINLLIVFPDEMRAQAQGFWQEDPAFTPNIDAFAQQSKVMNQMASNYPLCSPFRGMLMTGQYPIRNNVTGNAHDYGGKVGIHLSRYARCWSDVLKDEGYSLGYIGKWHLETPHEPYVESYNNPEEGRYWNEWTPPDRRHGFDFWHAYNTFDLHMTPMYWTNDTPRDKPLHVKEWGPQHEADVAIEYLQNKDGAFRDPNKPFALVVSMNPPHSPYNQVPQKYLDLYKDKTSKELNTRPNVNWDKKYLEGYGPEFFKEYLAMVAGVDEQFGRILNALKEQGLEDNTLVVFFSDHGCCLGSNGFPTKNNAYEESMRVPMMFRLPGKIAASVDSALMSAPDIYPTILDLMGFKDKIPGAVEGTSLAERILTGEGETPTSQLYLFVPYGEPSFGKRGVRTATHTLFINRLDGQPLQYTLYDNIKDPYQMHNIADSQPELVQKLIDEELLPWLEKTGDSWRPVEFVTGTVKKLNKKLNDCTPSEKKG